jgi:transposase
MATYKRDQVHYSLTFKREVLTTILRGEMSAYQAGRHFGVKGGMTIYRWLDNRDKIFERTFVEMSDKKNQNEERSQEESLADLVAELAATKRLLEIERLRSESYMTMIKLAEERYKIPIEKKSGTKQSK